MKARKSDFYQQTKILSLQANLFSSLPLRLRAFLSGAIEQDDRKFYSALFLKCVFHHSMRYGNRISWNRWGFCRFQVVLLLIDYSIMCRITNNQNVLRHLQYDFNEETGIRLITDNTIYNLEITNDSSMTTLSLI